MIAARSPDRHRLSSAPTKRFDIRGARGTGVSVDS